MEELFHFAVLIAVRNKRGSCALCLSYVGAEWVQKTNWTTRLVDKLVMTMSNRLTAETLDDMLDLVNGNNGQKQCACFEKSWNALVKVSSGGAEEAHDAC